MLNKNVFIWLMYFGALPFIAGALLSLLSIDSLSIDALPIIMPSGLDTVMHVVSLYALVIVVFMAGVLWGVMLSVKANTAFSQTNFIISNVITLALGIIYLILPNSSIFLVVTAIAFLWLLVIDKKLLQQQLIANNYYHARKRVSAMVVLSLIILATNNYLNAL